MTDDEMQDRSGIMPAHGPAGSIFLLRVDCEHTEALRWGGAVALELAGMRGLLALLDDLRRTYRTAVLVSTHFVHTVPEFADTVYVLAPDGRIAARGTPQQVFARPEVLEALDIEPPALSQLFQSLAQRGIALPAPLSVEHAADLLASHCRPGGRRLPGAVRGRYG
jgi:hypothetical protein